MPQAGNSTKAGGGAEVTKAPLQIWKGTRLSTLLLVHPEALDILVKFDSSLATMKDPEVRRMLAHRLSLGDLARRAGRPVEDILTALAIFDTTAEK